MGWARANFGQRRPTFLHTSTNLDRTLKTTYWSGQSRLTCGPCRPSLGDFGPSPGFRSNCSTSFGQLFSTFWATAATSGQPSGTQLFVLFFSAAAITGPDSEHPRLRTLGPGRRTCKRDSFEFRAAVSRSEQSPQTSPSERSVALAQSAVVLLARRKGRAPPSWPPQCQTSFPGVAGRFRLLLARSCGRSSREGAMEGGRG